MRPGIRNRIRKLEPCDRLPLFVTAVWSIAGIPANYFRRRGLMDGTGTFWLMAILWAAMAGLVAWPVIRRRRRLASYGFSFQRGGVASLALLVVIHLYLAIGGKLVLAAAGSYLLSAWGAFMEELAFRAIAIDKLILLLNGIRAKAFWAILASTVLFCAPPYNIQDSRPTYWSVLGFPDPGISLL